MYRIVCLIVFAAALSATIAAQSGGMMHGDSHTDKSSNMSRMAADATYTGCLQAGSTSGTFMLSGARQMMKTPMPGGTKGGEAMKQDAMAMTTLAVVAKSVDLRKHVGREVSVTGSMQPAGKNAMGHDESTLTVKAVKVVAAVCS